VTIDQIGPGEPVPAGRDARPLGALRVLDLTRVLAGPTVGRTLAEHGADVLLVNSPERPNVPPFVLDTGHGKRSAFVDLDTPDGATRLAALTRDADVFVQGYRACALERRGFGPEVLADGHRGLVYVTVNCYGDAGPWRDRGGWEQMAESCTGIADAQGEPGAPALVPAAACDYTTGYLGALGVMGALARRASDGGSYHVRVSLCQTGAWIRSLGAVCDPRAATGASARTITTETPFGRLQHLPPVAQLSTTPAHWSRPPVPLGTDEAAWPHG
jgi:crotonobetainyl-CoA:carnitine CoA-transferase CaiB-like acyl-CoA transferase